jgi:hypothetical protein
VLPWERTVIFHVKTGMRSPFYARRGIRTRRLRWLWIARHRRSAARFGATRWTRAGTRRGGYYIGKVIIPLVMIVAMSWVVFWMDPRESGVQISVAITAILTLIAYRFAIGTNVPKLEYMTRLDLFILGSSLLVFASLIQAMITSAFAKTDRYPKAREIDLWCRCLFPIVFVLIALETLMLRIVL